MTFLSRDHIKELILKQGFVTGYSDLEGQLTANGFDMRAAAIIEIKKAGKLAVEKKNNRAPELGQAWVLSGFENRLEGYKTEKTNVLKEGESVRLDPLKPYYILTIEIVKTPKHLMSKITARTSLFRLAQCMLETSFGEAGYNGYLTFMLMPVLPDAEIELGSRFAQVAFSQLSGESDYSSQKESSYQGGKIY